MKNINYAEELLKAKKSFAIIGASNEMLKYGYELVCVFKDYDYKIFPINPKYDEIEGIKCYSSLEELPEKPDVVLIALAPKNTNNAIDQLKSIGNIIVWLPPNCFDEIAVSKVKELSLDYVSDICPIGLMRKIWN